MNVHSLTEAEVAALPEYRPVEGCRCPSCRRYNALLNKGIQHGRTIMQCRDCGHTVRTTIPKKIVTSNGREAQEGDRLYNYYDCKWGVIERMNDHDDWFTFRHDDGTASVLNGQRVSTYKPEMIR